MVIVTHPLDPGKERHRRCTAGGLSGLSADLFHLKEECLGVIEVSVAPCKRAEIQKGGWQTEAVADLTRYREGLAKQRRCPPVIVPSGGDRAQVVQGHRGVPEVAVLPRDGER
ncbi:MAG TPA: hypothetical protein VI916_05450, partial [Acidimicrobiia bacterium]|nr:hypothetical protein [Acidimicrobiia bacterium]